MNTDPRRIVLTSAVMVSLAGSLATGTGAAHATRGLAADTLPLPTGPWAVATHRVVATDSTRPEPMTAREGDHRSVVLRLWYPVTQRDAEGRDRAPYVFGLSRLAGSLSRETLRSYRSTIPHAVLGPAPPAGPAAALPLVLLSPALGGAVSEYTSLAEDLASHGYAVVGIHPLHDGGLVAVPGGDVVPAHPKWTENQPERAGPERYFAFSRTRIEVMARDAVFVLDWLTARGEEAPSHLASRLRLERVGYVGHSLGGRAAALACALDARIGACVDMDGWPLPGRVEVAGVNEPFLYLEEIRPARSDAWLAEAGLNRTEYGVHMAILDLRKALLFHRSSAPGFHALISGAGHHSFSDRYLVRPSTRPPEAETDPGAAVAVTRELVRSFLSESLGPTTQDGEATSEAVSAAVRRHAGVELHVYRGPEAMAGRRCTPRDPSALLRLNSQRRAVWDLTEFWSEVSSRGGDSAGAAVAVGGRVLWSESTGGRNPGREARRMVVSRSQAEVELAGFGGGTRAADPPTGIALTAVWRDPAASEALSETTESAVMAMGRHLSFCGAR